MFKKILATLMAVMMLVSMASSAMATAVPDWTEYDQLIADIKASTDFAEREAMMHEAEDILMESACIVPLYYYNNTYMMKPTVEGFYSNVFGTYFFQNVTNGDSTTLALCLASEPDKLDPALNSSVDGASLATASFAGLYIYDETGVPVPNLATGYEVSEDGMTYVFTIREDLKWSDGTDLTAADFEYSWKRAASTETAADYGYMFNGIEGYPDALNVTASEDGSTFTVVMAAPCAYMMDLAAFPTFFPVQQAAVESADGYTDADGNVLSPGAWALEAGFPSSGPYMLESWSHDQSMVYVKNPYYWDAENVTIERLEFMLSADDSAIYSAYQNGDLDFIDTVPTDAIATLLAEENPEFYVTDWLGTYYINFNVKSELFDGLTVEEANTMRQALSKLIDRQYICDAIGQTGQVPATSFIPNAMLDGQGGVFMTSDEDYTYPTEAGYYEVEVDVDGAIEMLESIGFVFEGGMLSSSTPIAFEFLVNEGTGNVAVGECLQQDFAMVGIDMTIQVVEWNTFLNERKSGNYDIARNGWIADFNDPINMLEMWTTESGNNDVQYGR